MIPLVAQFWYEDWANTTTSVKLQVLVWTFALAAALNAWLLWHRKVAARRTLRRAQLSELLDTCVHNEELGIDPDGALNARMNVMTVHRWSRPVLFGFLRYPLIGSLQRLYVVACTENMRGSPDAGIGWRKGRGCVGQLWETGHQIACAAPLTEEDRREFQLTPEQAAKTEQLKCIVSVAILRDVGVEQRLLGFLNLDSDVEESAIKWTIDGQEVEKATATKLIAIAKKIASEDLLG
ncbi:MAG: hypothetical protein U9R79_01405 [Armatimonadota bacterium]|nr:hypothetical protein [Armatimonadota bacterium]